MEGTGVANQGAVMDPAIKTTAAAVAMRTVAAVTMQTAATFLRPVVRRVVNRTVNFVVTG